MSAGELSIEQRVALAEARISALEEAVLLAGPAAGARPPRMTLNWPVGTAEQRGKPWPIGDWYVAQGYAQPYPPSMNRKDYHTGIDLNLPGYRDSGQPVYAIGDGLVVYAGRVTGWQLWVVVIRHDLEDGSRLWSRYAHLDNLHVTAGQAVRRGDVLGLIGDYAPVGERAGDHLHFDLSIIDLGMKPGDWPGADVDRLRQDYVEPIGAIASRL